MNEILNLIKKVNIIKHNKKLFNEKFDEKIDEIEKKEILPLIERNIILPLEQYVGCKVDEHEIVNNKVVVIFKDKLSYEQHLGIKKYFIKEIKDYVRICYQWDFDDDLSVYDIIKKLKNKVKVEHSAESKLFNDYELLKETIETVDIINNLLILNVRCKEVSADEKFIFININIPCKHISKECKKIKDKIYSEIGLYKKLMLFFREIESDEK